MTLVALSSGAHALSKRGSGKYAVHWCLILLNRRSLHLTLAVLTAMLCVAPLGCASALDPPNIPTVQKPASLDDVLRNIKVAQDSGAMLRAEFFAEDNLRMYLGATIVDKSADSQVRIAGFVSGFPQAFAVQTARGVEVDGLSVAFQRISPKGASTVASLTISAIGKFDVGYETVTKLFGSNWKREQERLPSPHERVSPSTAEHGNTEIVYQTSNGTWVSMSRFKFAPDASLALASFSTKGNP